MDGTRQNTTQQGDDYSRALAAGFSADELKDSISGKFTGDALTAEHAKIDAAQPPPPKEAPAPSPIVEKEPTVPAPPPPTPGVYSPEDEQWSLRAADAIADPEMRMKVKANLKREYANDAMMDGITNKAREEGIKTAVSSYSTAVEKLRDDQKMSLDQKRALVQMLTKTMWQDPRTDYGDTRLHLEDAMQRIAFGENMMNLGPGFSAAMDSLANGTLTSARQVLQMENAGKLTTKGYSMIMGRLGTIDKPDKALDTRREALAIKHINGIIMKGFDEDNLVPGMKPPSKFSDMVDKATQAFYDSIEAAGDDRAAVRKAMSLEAISELVDQVYPWDQRMADRVRAGVFTGNVPPTVPKDERTQTAYKNIVSNPPTMTNKEGKSVQVPPATWQQGVEILRKTGQIDNFNKTFQTKDGAKIYKALPYIEPPPTVAPTPQPAEASPGFFRSMIEGYRSAIARPPTSIPERGAEFGAAIRDVGKAFTGQKLGTEEAKK